MGVKNVLRNNLVLWCKVWLWTQMFRLIYKDRQIDLLVNFGIGSCCVAY